MRRLFNDDFKLTLYITRIFSIQHKVFIHYLTASGDFLSTGDVFYLSYPRETHIDDVFSCSTPQLKWFLLSIELIGGMLVEWEGCECGCGL